MKRKTKRPATATLEWWAHQVIELRQNLRAAQEGERLAKDLRKQAEADLELTLVGMGAVARIEEQD